MKLPDAINQFLHKTPDGEEAYLSLVLLADAVQAAVWTLPPSKKPRIGEAAVERAPEDSWEKRLEACDRAIARLAEKEGRDDFEKVVLGLPTYYLTPDDDIEHDTRGYIKKLTEELELTPIGFVPLHQAIVHMIKQEEGVPPSVILLEVGPGKTAVILYKVGAVVGRAKIGSDDVVPELERALKSFKELEVLPSRILLYGANPETMEVYQRDLLKHAWPTRANFLHYPKIEVLPTLSLAGAVSLAGASELTSHMGEVAPPEPMKEEEAPEEEQNVVEVAPETLGFKRDVDILEKPEEAAPAEEREEPVKRQKLKETLARFVSGVKLPRVPTGALPKTAILLLIVLLLLVGGVGWLTYWTLPAVGITIFQVQETVSESASVTVNPSATVVDAASKTVPGRKQEKTASGDKTIAVTGEKDIGDPSRGTVTIYNKTLTSKQLKKGTILSTGSLSFTLDGDVSIASASESLASGSVTYGKGTSAITATKLGSQGNLPQGTEFVIRDTPTSVMVARNDGALSGGTSKVVTVVSRADQNALVAALTGELVEKAKSELASSVAGRERLIDETVKTSVTEKKFDAELDEEAKELHGSITVTISGTAYSEGDIASLFADFVAAKVPAGYTLRGDGGVVTATNVKLQKDGSIGLTVDYQGQAVPTFDLSAITSKLAGKSLSQAQEELRMTPGVGGVEIGKISWSLWGNKLPANAKNISIAVALLE